MLRSSEQDSLYPIAWETFADEADRKDVLAYIHWMSTDVSSDIDVECFEVKANIALKDQIVRLNNNRAFGGFCIRMLAEGILKELVFECLRNADLSTEPQADSLHEKIQELLKTGDLDFDELATRYQSANSLEQLEVNAASKVLAKACSSWNDTNAIKFGGY